MRLRPIRPPTPFERAARLVLAPVIAALLAAGSLVAGCQDHGGGSSQQDNRKFSARPDTGTESIQLSPCQRSAAACFESGGLGTLVDHLDGIGTLHGTGVFCYEFQDGCERR